MSYCADGSFVTFTEDFERRVVIDEVVRQSEFRTAPSSAV